MRRPDRFECGIDKSGVLNIVGEYTRGSINDLHFKWESSFRLLRDHEDPNNFIFGIADSIGIYLAINDREKIRSYINALLDKKYFTAITRLPRGTGGRSDSGISGQVVFYPGDHYEKVELPDPSLNILQQMKEFIDTEEATADEVESREEGLNSDEDNPSGART